MTKPSETHPWANYYAARGIARPQVAELAPAPAVRRGRAGRRAGTVPAPEVSSELAAAVGRVTAGAGLGQTAAPFITAMQKETVAREGTRRRRVQLVRWATIAAIVLVAVHFLVTRGLNRAPALAAAEMHAARLKADLLPLYSTARQPMQIDAVTVSRGEAIGTDRVRYVADVTVRLRKPLYAPAATNGTVAYRQLQVSLQAAREQELRYNLFEGGEGQQAPTLPLLIQVVHRAGEAMVVKVPFIARRFGWSWTFEAPQIGLRVANRGFEGDALDFYAGAPHLIFGGPQTLAEIRQRTAEAKNYVIAVAKEVQRHSQGRAITEPVPGVALAEAVAEEPVENRPAVDPDAPAIELPIVATLPAQTQTLALETTPARRG